MTQHFKDAVKVETEDTTKSGIRIYVHAISVVGPVFSLAIKHSACVVACAVLLALIKLALCPQSGSSNSSHH